MIKKFDLNETKMEILTKKNMSHMIAISPEGFYIPIYGVSVTHKPTKEDIIKVISTLITGDENLTEDELIAKGNYADLNVELSNTLSDGSLYEFNTLKDLTKLTAINVNLILKDVIGTFIKMNEMNSVEYAKTVMKDKMFLVTITSDYQNKKTGLVQNYVLSKDYFDLKDNTVGKIANLEYDRSSKVKSQGGVLKQTNLSRKARIVKEAITNFDYLNNAGKLNEERSKDLQERVWEYLEYLELENFQDFEIKDLDTLERNDSEEDNFQYAKLFYGYMLSERLSEHFLPLTYVSKRGELVPVDHTKEEEEY